MRERVREWRRNHQRPVGLNSTRDADTFVAALRMVRQTPPAVDETQEIPAVAPESTPDPAPERGPAPVPLARGLCPLCRRQVKVRKDGTVPAHRGCDGEGEAPLALCTVCVHSGPLVYAETLHALGHPRLVWDADAA